MTGMRGSTHTPLPALQLAALHRFAKPQPNATLQGTFYISKIKPPLSPTLHWQRRTIFNRKRHIPPLLRSISSLSIIQIETWRSAVGNCFRQRRDQLHVWRKQAWNKMKNKTEQSRQFVVTCSEASPTLTCGGNCLCGRHVLSKRSFHKI